jgi:hypothetical protein
MTNPYTIPYWLWALLTDTRVVGAVRLPGVLPVAAPGAAARVRAFFFQLRVMKFLSLSLGLSSTHGSCEKGDLTIVSLLCEIKINLLTLSIRVMWCR